MTKKFLIFLLVLLMAFAVVGCAQEADPTEAPATEEAAPAETEEAMPEPVAVKVCQVTDTGGIDDKSFNATAWKGVERAQDELGAEGKYLESQQQTDYEKNINAFIRDGCDLIVPIGFLLGDATAVSAEANPDQKFAIVDFAYDPGFDNVLGMVFATDQAGFLAGYVAAGVSKTGKVGTFGGINIPPVTGFMDGYALGVDHYNKVHGTSVEVLGWDVEAQDGLFTGNFESTDDGRAMGESLMDEGADVIMPVAGPVGLGTAAAAKDRGDTYIVGVDTDWYVSAAEYGDIILTSVLKNMDVAVFEATKNVQAGTFSGGLYVGTLENGGVGLADFHDLDGMVSAELKAELETVTADIISGVLSTAQMNYEEIKVCQVTDTGGIDDKSFNATAWMGVERAMEELGAEGKYLESQQQTDYEKNINAFIRDGCNLIVPIGFLLGDATAASAEANPDQKFAIVDFAYDPGFDNVLGMVFATDQAGFLAGYVAAGVTKTGKVGTFGGINIPPVTDFMNGYALGVAYYNSVNGTSVEVLGWDVVAKDGLFTGNFESTDDGRAMGESLMDEGADVIMPVAGPVGLGTAAAAKDRGNTYIIGVDTDWTVSAAEYSDIILTSVLKNMDVAVFGASKNVAAGRFTGGLYIGTLANGGVGLADFNELDSMVSADLKAQLETVTADIIAGTISTTEAMAAPEVVYDEIKVCQVTDTGGIDDKSFNATAWMGVERAQEELGAEGKYLESQQQTDYEKNINAFIRDGCDLIVPIGFLLGDATAAAAEANPEQNFAIVDFAYDPEFANVLGMVFAVDQAGFLAGYVAAGTSKTGKVGTFGGINIPPVTQFMDGYALGVAYYNAENGTAVEVLGWDVEAQDGLFTGNFESTDDGRAMGESLMDEGADVILPVAGPVGLGTAAAAKDRGEVYIIGVDTDWTVSAAEYADIILTSILKNMNVAVFEAAKGVASGTFAGGLYVGTLENGGVGLSELGDMAPDLMAGLEAVTAGIIAGDIPTMP